jgi:hypothetical protein
LPGLEAVHRGGIVVTGSVRFSLGAHGPQRLSLRMPGARQQLPHRRIVRVGGHPGLQGAGYLGGAAHAQQGLGAQHQLWPQARALWQTLQRHLGQARRKLDLGRQPL